MLVVEKSREKINMEVSGAGYQHVSSFEQVKGELHFWVNYFTSGSFEYIYPQSAITKT